MYLRYEISMSGERIYVYINREVLNGFNQVCIRSVQDMWNTYPSVYSS